MNQRTKLIAATVLLTSVTLLFVPFVPCQLPETQWHESDFENIKTRIISVEGRLLQLKHQLQEQAGDKRLPTFNLIAEYGEINMFRSLLGSTRIGTSSKSTWAFGSLCLPGIPTVRYDQEKKTAQITPQQIEAFLDWAAHVEIDTSSLSYRTSAHP